MRALRRAKEWADSDHHIAWRGQVLWRAVRSLLEVGGNDLAASLAYYTLLSIVPFIVLLVLVSSAFIDQETVREHLSQVVSVYFPASSDFLEETITPLMDVRVVTGVISFLGVLWGANGLFFATNRNVNRVFGSRQRTILKRPLTDMALGLGVIGLFLASIGLSGLFRVGVDLAASYEGTSRLLGELAGVMLRAILVALPPFVTFLVFAIVYDKVPTISVPWRDSTFGALVAATLFEGVKYFFFWITTTLGHQSLIYGPLTSVIILLIWSQLGALIFLFGAAVARQSMWLRLGV